MYSVSTFGTPRRHTGDDGHYHLRLHRSCDHSPAPPLLVLGVWQELLGRGLGQTQVVPVSRWEAHRSNFSEMRFEGSRKCPNQEMERQLNLWVLSSEDRSDGKISNTTMNVDRATRVGHTRAHHSQHGILSTERH